MIIPTQSFYFIRHGETDYNAQNICMGQLDIELNEHGRSQAKQARETLANHKIDLIFHSFLKRTCETAQIINQNNIEMQELRGIEERNCGDFQGLNKNKIKELRAKAGYYFFPDNAETDTVFKNRVQKAFDQSLKSTIGKNVLFVSHGGVFKILLQILGIENLAIKNCDIVKFISPDKDQNRWTLKIINSKSNS